MRKREVVVETFPGGCATKCNVISLVITLFNTYIRLERVGRPSGFKIRGVEDLLKNVVKIELR